jgi:hypothetical protein
MRLGYEWVHSIVDVLSTKPGQSNDYSRFAYSELHPDERAETVTGFVERALAHSASSGSSPSGCFPTTPSSTDTTARCANSSKHTRSRSVHPAPTAANKREG